MQLSKIIVGLDSFKGALSSLKANRQVSKGFQEIFPQVQIEEIPMADGGEGTVESLHFNLGGTLHQTQVSSIEKKSIPASFLVLNSSIAVFEISEIVGFSDQAVSRTPIEQRSTYGIGVLIRHILDKGFRNIWIGLGGSSTNDGGMGMLAALGAHFSLNNHPLFSPTLKDFSPYNSVSSFFQAVKIDFSNLDPRLQETEITILSDVKNPLCGEQGATAIFGPQKGVQASVIQALDQTIHHYSVLVEKAWGLKKGNFDFQHGVLGFQQGAGAAGGLGFAFLVLGAQMKPGAQFLLEKIQFSKRILETSLVITGEGRSDQQTLQGKLPHALAQIAKEKKIPILLLSGAIEFAAYDQLEQEFTCCHSISNGPLKTLEAIQNTEFLLYHASKNLARMIRHCQT